MKYKAKFDKYEKLTDDELLCRLLIGRGVEEPDKLINLNENVIKNTKLFKNIEEGLYLIDKYILNGGKIRIIVDSDADGYTSSAFTYLELKKLNKNIDIKYIIHEGKEHGILLSELENIGYDFDLLIVPDAGSLDLEQCKELKKMNKEVLILDHHKYDKDNPNAVLINCQDKSYENNTLSGVGVVYKFFHLYEQLLGYPNYSDTMLDIVSVGMIGDSVDLRNYESRYLCLQGLELLNKKEGNKFITSIAEKQEGRIGNIMTIKKIGWNIVPLLNAVVRVGTMEEKEDVFKALIDSNETREYQPRRKKKTDPKPDIEIQDLQTYMARVCTNIKARQDKLVTKGVGLIENKIKELHLADDNNKIIIVDGTEELEKTFTGYVANRLAGYYKRPVLIYRRKGEDKIGGSGRNYDLFEMNNFRQFLLDTNEFNFVDGHDEAFGFELDRNKLNKIKETINNKLKDVNIEDTYHVDFAIPIGRLKSKHVLQVGQWEHMWGNSIEEPKFAITDIYVDISDIQLLGEKQNVLSITKTVGSSQIKFIKLVGAKDCYNKMLGRESEKGLNKNKRTSNKIGLDIIGTFKINKFNDNEYAQIEIIDFTVLKEREITF